MYIEVPAFSIVLRNKVSVDCRWSTVFKDITGNYKIDKFYVLTPCQQSIRLKLAQREATSEARRCTSPSVAFNFRTTLTSPFIGFRHSLKIRLVSHIPTPFSFLTLPTGMQIMSLTLNDIYFKKLQLLIAFVVTRCKCVKHDQEAWHKNYSRGAHACHYGPSHWHWSPAHHQDCACLCCIKAWTSSRTSCWSPTRPHTPPLDMKLVSTVTLTDQLTLQFSFLITPLAMLWYDGCLGLLVGANVHVCDGGQVP